MILNKIPSYEGKLSTKTWKEECYDEFGNYIGKWYYEIQCDVCGKIFTDKKPLKKYCSPECSMKENNKRRKERKAKYRDKICEYCNKQFTPKRNDTKFCSDACRQAMYRGKDEIVKDRIIYTVGANWNIEMLKNNGIKCMIDTNDRRFTNQEVYKALLAQNGIKYRFAEVLNDRYTYSNHGRSGIRSDYISKKITDKEYEDYYIKNTEERINIKLVLDVINKYGKTVFLCDDDKEDVKYRYILTEFIKKTGDFDNVINL